MIIFTAHFDFRLPPSRRTIKRILKKSTVGNPCVMPFSVAAYESASSQGVPIDVSHTEHISKSIRRRRRVYAHTPPAPHATGTYAGYIEEGINLMGVCRFHIRYTHSIRDRLFDACTRTFIADFYCVAGGRNRSAWNASGDIVRREAIASFGRISVS
ncbi:hypothetical protein EVAR_3699_1 [Eumeta japonica]|uniref:Uncharacterized protein n=1 Tax=Eumeta variegata TaxID=151549 RepID=A0A4C1SRH7_EUMVA|nr:hypothetical protein EVAR_3699_1 [Eumeta japonica]